MGENGALRTHVFRVLQEDLSSGWEALVFEWRRDIDGVVRSSWMILWSKYSCPCLDFPSSLQLPETPLHGHLRTNTTSALHWSLIPAAAYAHLSSDGASYLFEPYADRQKHKVARHRRSDGMRHGRHDYIGIISRHRMRLDHSVSHRSCDRRSTRAARRAAGASGRLVIRPSPQQSTAPRLAALTLTIDNVPSLLCRLPVLPDIVSRSVLAHRGRCMRNRHRYRRQRCAAL
ncbi:hypothetical protein FA95DRAFT_562105 [Auriscalpium vulgare]|uniref:Uncharacterized protein n=1 Tax=Auriscalpium vulgare TaxID=40419 RepID=A0ACB8RF64_9AGAM|nr:hypothetical protein FA95DRAFT_562105 [Auriscalpium vulgare]